MISASRSPANVGAAVAPHSSAIMAPMTRLAAPPAPGFAPRTLLARGALTLAFSVSAIVALVALASGFGILALPFEMWLLDQRLPAVFRVHMVASALALLLLPAAIGWRHRPRLHRRIGWLLGAFVVLGGLSAFPVAIISHSSVAARAGFFVQGLVWLGLFAAAIAAIRNGERARHVQLMLAMTAVTTGAVWFRLITGSAIAFGWPFEVTYALASWVAWIVPLTLVIAHRRRLTAWAFRPPPARASTVAAQPANA